MNKLMNGLTRAIELILVVLFIVMVVAIFGQVVARYVFGKALFWAEELGIYTMIWSCFLGTAIAVRKKAHTNVSFFVNLLSKKKRIMAEEDEERDRVAQGRAVQVPPAPSQPPPTDEDMSREPARVANG
jgi:hypothetical protein